MAGSEYELKTCPQERKDIETGDVMKVPIFNNGSCGKSSDCRFLCEHKKE
jgi:hypothetical protein